MRLFDLIRQALGDRAAIPTRAAADRPAKPEPPRVPELTAAELAAERQNGHGLLLLDCREDYEWRQGYIPGSLHIPMRQIPERLAYLDPATDVVVCAHGNRSYSVAGWLIARGYRARSLRGGLADWQLRGYPTARP